jgi:nucleoid-associated protein YgaU
MSSGKNLALLMLVAVAAGTAVLTAKKPDDATPRVVEPAPRETLARRLPTKSALNGTGQHRLRPHDDTGSKAPTASVAGSPDLGVGVEYVPSPGPYGRSFNPAAALLDAGDDLTDRSADVQPVTDSPLPIGVSASAKPRTHVVADGDTLTSLAARYLGSADRFREIFAANRQLLTTPNLLPIGATLQIPSAEAGPAGSEP